jgi:hypothetical protein
MTELVGYCFHCSNFATWDEEKQNMVCFAYPNGIPDSMWQRVEAGKECLWRNKDRIEIEHKASMKKIEEISKMDIPDEEKAKLFEKWLEKQSRD